ncbi:PBP1 and LysM peptidoglycan-binding domain-containing protein [Parabacteroides pacaensis]|uniref:PBP1 and LysM peptidoglycan-binding domain-containing protein n=1 Tax=Parabacteroides pacaensis TaxID=2086575 RepID=UPI000D10B641|nr:LysM peptidoglycan-binding domain-containing protein [Parabacteroides pacaensis]
MNKISLYVIIFFLGLASLNVYSQQNKNINAPASKQANDIFYHTVEAGQTVYAIAIMYGVGVEDIYKLNPTSKEYIKTGEKLKIPQKKETATPNHPQEDQSQYIYHTIERGETLYSLSNKYNVSAEEIARANPGLSIQTLIAGKNIRIPNVPAEDKIIEQVKTIDKDTKYVVKKNDTFYSIGRRFDITQEELIRRNPSLKNGLKAGATIYIPERIEVVISTTTQAPREDEVNALLRIPQKIQRVNVAKVALLLPFMANEALSSSSSRFLEYYEGFLLAMDSLRNKGYSVDLYVYDTGNGTKKIKDILKKEEMKEVNLIIGAVQNDQIKLIADFANQHNIKYVIPFTSTNDDVLNNASIFQVNTPHSYLYAKASQAAADLFRDYNIVILNCNDGKEEKTDFIKTLKMELKNKNIPFKEFPCDEFFADTIASQLSIDIPNVIIPTSASSEVLAKILPPLRQLAETTQDYRLSLFGYPEWQIHTKDYLEDFYLLNTYIYSHFYADNLSPEIKKFYQDYKTWYSKSPTNTFPKYGMLGFDTGLFFIEALHNYGENFENNLSKMHYKSIQTGFNFERVNNWGGFINTNLFIVHYKNNFTVSRTEVNSL